MNYNIEQQAECAAIISSLKNTIAEIEQLPADYDYPPPVMVSHAKNYANDLLISAEVQPP